MGSSGSQGSECSVVDAESFTNSINYNLTCLIDTNIWRHLHPVLCRNSSFISVTCALSTQKIKD